MYRGCTWRACNRTCPQYNLSLRRHPQLDYQKNNVPWLCVFPDKNCSMTQRWLKIAGLVLSLGAYETIFRWSCGGQYIQDNVLAAVALCGPKTCGLWRRSQVLFMSKCFFYTTGYYTDKRRRSCCPVLFHLTSKLRCSSWGSNSRPVGPQAQRTCMTVFHSRVRQSWAFTSTPTTSLGLLICLMRISLKN